MTAYRIIPIKIVGQSLSDAVPSPCVKVCRIHPATGWCEGCLRTVEEIAQWASLNIAGQRAVLARLGQRRATLAAS